MYNQPNTYGGGVEFATAIFKFFNGKINPLFPARYMLFGPCSAANTKGDFGASYGDVIQVDMHRVLEFISLSGYSVESYKGLILYTVIHELLHLEQDFSVYYQLTSTEQEAEELIERSCHCMTYAYLKSLSDENLFGFEFGPQLSYSIPHLSWFVQDVSKREDWEDVELQLLRSYYRIPNPYNKALWFLNAYVYGNPSLCRNDLNTIWSLTKEYQTVFMTVEIGGERVRSGYVTYMGKWLSPRAIMDVLNPIIVAVQQDRVSFHPEVPTVDVDALINEKEFPEVVWVQVRLNSNMTTIEIVNQLPFDEQPIPPIL